MRDIVLILSLLATPGKAPARREQRYTLPREGSTGRNVVGIASQTHQPYSLDLP